MGTKEVRSKKREPLNWTNNTGSAVALNDLVRTGLGWGRAKTSIAAGAQGVLQIEGSIKVDKVSGDVISAGDTIYWNTSTKKAALGTSTIGASNVSPVPLGVARAAAGDGTTSVEVELNEEGEQFIIKTTGSHASPGVQYDTGLGKTPTGPVTIMVLASDGTYRVISSAVWGTSGNAGKVTVITSAGASSDVIIISGRK